MVLGAPIGVTPGSVLFGGAGGVLAQDNANFFFDDVNNQLQLTAIGAGAGLLIGGDTQLYRSAANVLRTPNFLTVDGSVTISGGALTLNSLAPFISLATVDATDNGGLFLSGGGNSSFGPTRGAGLQLYGNEHVEVGRLYIQSGNVAGGNVIVRVGNNTPVATFDDSRITTFTNKIFPGTDTAAAQSAAGLYAGTGVPNNANGNNGDFYFRSDGTVAGNTVQYHKEAGAWVAYT
jgi:hypothetical protein